MLPAEVLELDRAIQEQDRLILRAYVERVPIQFIWAAVQVRNDLVRDWGQAIQGVA